MNKKCISCQKSISTDNLCNDCWTKLRMNISSSYCKRCGRCVSDYISILGCANCIDQKYNFDQIVCASTYGNVVRTLILKLKFADAPAIGNLLGSFVKIAFESTEFPEPPSYIVPVPLHWRRRLARGYNQSLVLAKTISDGKIEIKNHLIRTRHTPEQGKLSHSKRKKNVEGAFALRRNADVMGKNICLVDDIKTTGATLNECAKVLKAAGAKNIYAIVIAVAGNNQIS